MPTPVGSPTRVVGSHGLRTSPCAKLCGALGRFAIRVVDLAQEVKEKHGPAACYALGSILIIGGILATASGIAVAIGTEGLGLPLGLAGAVVGMFTTATGVCLIVNGAGIKKDRLPTIGEREMQPLLHPQQTTTL